MRDFSHATRIVVKVGTNILSHAGGIDPDRIAAIAQQLAALRADGRQVILVTSGAIGMGAAALGIKHKISDVKKRQACAAVGQAILMHEYEQAFANHDQKVAQVLLTYAHFSNRKYYVNLRNTVDTLLSMGIVPIINENDCVSIDEIDLAFGDNDKLSALVASKIDAHLLILLTDVAGLYDRQPKPGSNAQLISVVYEITPEIEAMAGKAGSTFSTGGMTSKFRAIEIAASAGCKVVLADGRQNDTIPRILAGETVGTLFLPKSRLSNRKRWILQCRPDGRISVDPGAAHALKNRKSLLLVGVTACQGNFKPGDVVTISLAGQDDHNAIAKGRTRCSARDLNDLLAQRSPNTPTPRRAIVHADDLVLL